MTDLTKVKGVGDALAKALQSAGIPDAEAMAAAGPEVLMTVPGIGGARAVMLAGKSILTGY